MAVYFIGNGRGQVKIGTASNVKSRLSGLQTGSPDELELLAYIPGGNARERKLHDEYAEYRIRGEWFELSHRIQAGISAYQEIYHDYMHDRRNKSKRRIWEDAFEEYHAKTSIVEERYDTQIEALEAARDAEVAEIEAEFDAATDGIHPWWLEEESAGLIHRNDNGVEVV